MKSAPQAKSFFGRTAALASGVLALAGLGGAGAFTMLYVSQQHVSQQPASAEPAIPSGVALTSWFDNGAGGEHLLRIRQGRAPATGAQVKGTVMTDTNCDPDAEGLSHCHNIIDFGNGRSIEVVNTHIMSRHPCLSPGQRLTLTRLNADWVIAFEGQPARRY